MCVHLWAPVWPCTINCSSFIARGKESIRGWRDWRDKKKNIGNANYELMSGRQISVSSLFIFKGFLLFVHLFAFGQRCFALSCGFPLFFFPLHSFVPVCGPFLWRHCHQVYCCAPVIFFPACCSEFPNRFCGLFVNYLYLWNFSAKDIILFGQLILCHLKSCGVE